MPFAPFLGLICVNSQDHRIVRSPPRPAHRASSLPYRWAAATQSLRGRRAPTTQPTRPPPPSHVEQLPSLRQPPTHPPAWATQAPHHRALALPCPPCHLCTALQDLPATSMATPSLDNPCQGIPSLNTPWLGTSVPSFDSQFVLHVVAT